MQCLLRFVYLIGVAVGNIILVSTSGDVPILGIPFNHGLTIVLYNAAALMFVYLADWLWYKTMRARLEYHLGEKLIEE